MGKWAYDSAGGVATWVPWLIDADKIGGRTVATTTPTTNDVLAWNGTSWAPAAASAGAPTSAQYVTLATDATLTAERTLAVGGGLTLADGGAGSTVTVGDGRTLLWAWNETNTSQFTLGGSTADWTVAYSASGGPAGEPCITFTTLSNAAGDLYVYPTSQPTLGDYYQFVIGLGPYTGQSANGKRCLPCPAFAFMDTGNWYGFGPAGDNTGGAGAQMLQAVQRSGGAAVTAANIANAWANHATAKATVSARIAIASSTTLAMGVQAFGMDGFYAYSGPTNTGRGIGLRVAHYGQTRAIGDSTYVYGWKVYGKGSL